jgi:hypothetical protein
MSEGVFIATSFPYSYIKSSFDTFAVSDMLGRYEKLLTISFSGRMSFFVFASSHWLATVPSNFLVGLFARSDIPVVQLSSCLFTSPFCPDLPFSEEAITELVTQDTCRELGLSGFNLNEAHFHALRRASSSLELTLGFCNATVGPIAATETAFVKCLVGIQCPVNVRWNGVNTGIIARALPGASHLHKLTLDVHEYGGVAPCISSTIQSLAANTGLVGLSVSTRCNGFDFPTLCHSLRSHTTLTSRTAESTLGFQG